MKVVQKDHSKIAGQVEKSVSLGFWSWDFSEFRLCDINCIADAFRVGCIWHYEYHYRNSRYSTIRYSDCVCCLFE